LAPLGVTTSTLVPLGLADESARKRGRDGDLSLFRIRLGLADQLPHLLLRGVLVHQGDGSSELDRVAGELGDVDHFGARKLVLELGDATLVVRLGFLGGVIFGVLGEVAVGARSGNELDDPRPLSARAQQARRIYRIGLWRVAMRVRRLAAHVTARSSPWLSDVP
jgi:hypothetical protein